MKGKSKLPIVIGVYAIILVIALLIDGIGRIQRNKGDENAGVAEASSTSASQEASEEQPEDTSGPLALSSIDDVPNAILDKMLQYTQEDLEAQMATNTDFNNIFFKKIAEEVDAGRYSGVEGIMVHAFNVESFTVTPCEAVFGISKSEAGKNYFGIAFRVDISALYTTDGANVWEPTEVHDHTVYIMYYYTDISALKDGSTTMSYSSFTRKEDEWHGNQYVFTDWDSFYNTNITTLKADYEITERVFEQPTEEVIGTDEAIDTVEEGFEE